MGGTDDDMAMKPLKQKQQGGAGSPTITIPGDDDIPYDPHKHRNVPNPTSNGETLVHLIKGSLGTGILAMPQAFHNSGSINGVISTIIIGFLCTYCLHILVQAQYELCKRKRVPILTYPISMKEALLQGPDGVKIFAPLMPLLVDGFLILYQIGICCVYIVFVATNIKKVADYYWTPIDERLWMCIILVPLILLNLIKNLKVMAPFSQVANIITFFGIGIVMYYIFTDLPPIDSKPYFGEARNYVLYVGTTLFALEAVGVIIALENNMERPKSFGGTCGVLNIGMTMIVVVYIFVGFFGYIRYGDKAEGSITLNLNNTEYLAQAVNVIFAIAIFISYALQCYVPVDIIWNTYLKERFENHSDKVTIEYCMRISVVIATFVPAVVVPRLGLFISLFGALCLSVLGIAFPALMDICVKYPNSYGPLNVYLWRDFFLIIFGILGLLIGTYTSLSDIIASF